MTEAEWLASDCPYLMLEHLDAITPSAESEDPAVWPVGRKLRLFAVACCRRIEHLLTDPRSRAGLAMMERYVDGRATKADLRKAIEGAAKVTWDYERETDGRYQAATAACTALEDIQDDFQDIGEAAEHAADAVTGAIPEGTPYRDELYTAVHNDELNQQAALLRDIFGNPFRPVAVDPSWLTSDVLALARGIYDERAFDRMPILADALQDAGCDNDDVLTHCRDASRVHVRGCWVVDLLLGNG